jgi:L-glyceraldehyde 3-phosphate reductase
MVGDDEELRIATVDAAMNGGITYFDTAFAYGWGRSETNLSRALRRLDAKPMISTKFCLQPHELVDPRAAVLEGFQQNLARLGLERVEALLMHNRVADHEPGQKMNVGALLNLEEMFGKNGVAEALRELLDAGLVDTVGFTSFGGDPAAIREMLSSGLFGSINASFSLLNPSAARPVPAGFSGADYETVIQSASAADVGVMAIQVLGRGVLAAGESEQGAALQAVAAELGDSLISLAIRYVLSTPGVTTAILGLSEPSHVHDAVAAEGRGPLSTDEIARLEAVVLGA